MKKVTMIKFVFILLLAVLFLTACGGDKTEKEGVDVVGMLTKDPPNITIKEKEPEIGCKYDNPECNANNTCIENECILKQGCQYNNPECDVNNTCSNNECIPKQGCQYNNPPCSSSLTCIDNRCILAQGCNWAKPPCDTFEECVNNECKPKKGCANNNPPCDWGKSCQNNVCIGTATGVLNNDEFKTNRHWGNLQDVEESGVDLGKQDD